MNTGLTNLGPSLGGMAGLGAKSRGEERSLGIDSKKDFQVSDFEKVLGSRTNELERLQNAKSENQKLPSQKNDGFDSRPEKNSARLEPKPGPMKDRPEQKSSGKAAESGKLETTVKAKNEGGLEKSSTNAEKKAEMVMQQFMDSLESELGIPPEDIVEAMTELPTDQLVKSPESTASQVIGKLSTKLSLSKDEQARAMELYLGMLQQLQRPMESLKQPMLMGAFGGASLLAASKVANQEKLQGLNNSLDQLNNQFFGPQKMAINSEASSAIASMKRELSAMQPEMASEIPGSEANAMDNGMQTANLNVNQLADAKMAEGASLQGMKSVDPNSAEAQSLLKSLAAISASAAGVNQALSNEPAIQRALRNEKILNQLRADGLISDSASSQGSTEGLAGAGLAPVGAGVLGGAMLSEKSPSGDSSFGDDRDSSESELKLGELGENSTGDLSKATDFAALKPLGQTNLSQGQNLSEATVSGMAAGAMIGKSESMTAQQQAVNAQRLMNQAQILLKHGGGEAKITMAPEGIGQIHMKMTLLDGKMNLEMQAESRESKKLIESSIGELRSSLGHHNIAVDQIKVDLSQKSGFDPQSSNGQQQNMADSRQEPSKEQMRNFWNQFESGSERRNQFNDGSGIRAYGGQRREPSLKAVDSGSSSVVPRQLGSGKGRGLNLVA